MTGTYKAEGSMKRGGLAMLIAGVLLLTAGAGVLPASAKGNSGWDDLMALGSKPSIIKRSDISASGSNPNTLVRKPGIAGGTNVTGDVNVVTLGSKIGIASGSNATGSGSNSNAIRAAVVSQLRR